MRKIKMTCNSSCGCGSGGYSCEPVSDRCQSEGYVSKVNWNVFKGLSSSYTIIVHNVDLVDLAAVVNIDFIKSESDTEPLFTLTSSNQSQIRITNNLVNGELPTGECLKTFITLQLSVSQVDIVGQAGAVVYGDLLIASSLVIPPIRFNLRYKSTTDR